jgi:hypothetical protein
MATRGRKPKPVEQKVRIGNPGKRAIPKIAIVEPTVPTKGIPEPHRFLIHGNDGTVGPGRRLWNDIWSSGAGWLKYETDGEMAMMVCEQTDERAVLRLRLLNGGDWRDRAQLRQLEKLIASNLSLLGFTPTDRARLGGNTAPIDELNIFRQKVNAKRATA